MLQFMVDSMLVALVLKLQRRSLSPVDLDCNRPIMAQGLVWCTDATVAWADDIGSEHYLKHRETARTGLSYW